MALRQGMSWLNPLAGLFALAALVFAFAAPLDAFAGAAHKLVEAGNPSSFLKALSALDVVDDLLDHAPGEAGKVAQHVVVEPVFVPETLISAAGFQGRELWSALPTDDWGSRPVDRLDRPPRR